MTDSKAIKKYLAAHAEAELVERLSLSRRYRHVACIPACDEAETLPKTLEALSQARGSSDALVIVVLNGRAKAPQPVHQANADLAEKLRIMAGLPVQPMAEGRFRGMGLVLVDRYSEGRRLPHDQGVGLARKIAADLALAWMEDGRIDGPWIRSTDADVQVPPSYWEEPSKDAGDRSAVIYPFAHVPEGDALQRQALASYEAYLRYYVHGLKQAGSPYAFHSIGSLICFHHEAYAQVRGMPKRQAGEDFYLLNKLAKVGQVETLTGESIRLSGRTSDRVPFGTGLAVAQIRDQLAQGLPYEVYDPRIFTALKQWLDALAVATKTGSTVEFHRALEAVAPPLGPILRRAVEITGSLEPVEAALAAVQGQVLHKRIHDWQDAFRTLKMVHALRDEGLGTVPLAKVFEPLGSGQEQSTTQGFGDGEVLTVQ